MEEKYAHIIAEAASDAGADPMLLIALATVASGGNPHMMRYDSLYPRVDLRLKRPEDITLDTESLCQRMKWGIFQLQGARARRLGFDGWFSELTDAAQSSALAAKLLHALQDQYGQKHGLDGIISAWFGESLRTRPDGNYQNQPVVDAVLKELQRLREAEKEVEETVDIPAEEPVVKKQKNRSKGPQKAPIEKAGQE